MTWKWKAVWTEPENKNGDDKRSCLPAFFPPHQPFCLPLCTFLPFWLPVLLPFYLSACLSTFLPTSLNNIFVCPPIFLSAYQPLRVPTTSLSTHQPFCLPTNLVYPRTFLPTHQPSYPQPNFQPAYPPIFLPAYRHLCLPNNRPNPPTFMPTHQPLCLATNLSAYPPTFMPAFLYLSAAFLSFCLPANLFAYIERKRNSYSYEAGPIQFISICHCRNIIRARGIVSAGGWFIAISYSCISTEINLWMFLILIYTHAISAM